MTPYYSDQWLTVYGGDCRAVLREMEPESVHCVVTSPPYWGLRDYGTATWEGGDEGCDHVQTSMRPSSRSTLEDHGPDGRSPQLDALPGIPFRSLCRKCGATRIDSQLGLEETPEQYVAALVEVFREVRRVLRSDGTAWLNLGDSYSGSWSGHSMRPDGGEQRPGVPGFQNLAAGYPSRPPNVPGLKPKDLVGIPWRVAFALQQPYYTGRIKTEADRIWLAAMVDAEGCIHIHRRSAGSSAHSTYERKDGTTASYVRKNDTFGVMVSVDNTSQAIVDRCAAIFGQGSRYVDEAGTKVQQRKQTLYRWTVTGDQARDLLRELYPYLVGKQQQARIAIGSPSSGGADAQEAIKSLHAGREVTLDYPAPAPLYEPGWYLRSDVIWAKSNPMPESVTDRPTKSHEYLFLLAKSARYFFDADAVREPQTNGSQADVIARAGLNAKYQEGGLKANHLATQTFNPAGRNIRSVWQIATAPYPGAHFATFPPKLVEPCVKAGTSEKGVCPECGAPWERVVERTPNPSKGTNTGYELTGGAFIGRTSNPQTSAGMHRNGTNVAAPPPVTTGWRPTCAHTAEPVPATCLDPFAGTGTVGLVAQSLSRRAVLIDLNPDYLKQCLERNRDIPLGLPA